MKRAEGEQQKGYREWTSSKGNQSKWFLDGNWYKADGLGYEALSEVLVSRLLEKTNIGDFVRYEYENLEREGVCRHGCRSCDFLEPEDDKLVSVERLFQAYKGESAARGILAFAQTKEKIRYVVNSKEGWDLPGMSHF